MGKIDYKRYQVAYLYIKNFEHKQFPVGERFNHEPLSGKIYKVIKDLKANSYRMVISGVEGESEGIVFDKLIDSNRVWEHEMVELTFENIASIDIPEEEAKKAIEWMQDVEGEKEFIRWALLPPEEYVSQKGESTQTNRKVDQHPEYADVMRGIINNFHAISKGGDGVADVMVDLLEFLKTTYSDKYETADTPIRAKEFLYDRDHGTAVNMFCSSKYLQRYLTQGFDKSNNPMDLFKAIHYILFEIARVKITEYAEKIRKDNHGDNTRPKEADKKPRRRGRPPKGTGKGEEETPKG